MIDHWPELRSHNSSQSSLTPQNGLQKDSTSTSTKRSVDAFSDSSDTANVDYLPPLTNCTKVIIYILVSQPPLPSPGVSPIFPSCLLSDLLAFVFACC